MFRVSLSAILVLLLVCPAVFAGLDPSYSADAPIDTVPFFAGGEYIDSIPAPNDFVQYPLDYNSKVYSMNSMFRPSHPYFKYPIGCYPLMYHELPPYLEALAAASDRVMLEIQGATFEYRRMYSVIISSEENIRKIEYLKSQNAKLADPASDLTEAELERIYTSHPAFAWLGYSIHGDELSGVDAAIQLIYQLAAGTDAKTLEILDNTVIVIDPIQNPDGRARYMSMLQTYQSQVPNYNQDAMQHSGVWPWGRTNHYLFDLNRDWFALTQPESKAKMLTVLEWNPQMLVDAHEMGSNDSYLFSPPREPVNYNTAPNVMKWYKRFAKDQGDAFDERGWTYYVGEWHEQWYPGYGSSWPTLTGAVSILYEQAGVGGQSVKQRDGYILTYHEAVNKQFTSSYTNLRTLTSNREEILRDYRSAREAIVEEGRRSGLTFFFKPDPDVAKMGRFIGRLDGQGIEVKKAEKPFVVSSAHDVFGKVHKKMKLPAGTYVVSTDQVSGALAKAILEFDPHLKLDFLEEERREIEKFGDTKMYEVSTWSVPLAYDIEAYWSNARFDADLVEADCSYEVGEVINPDATIGFVADMVGELTHELLTRLFAEGIVVRAAEKPFTIEGRSYSAGALFIRKRGNASDLVAKLESIANEGGLDMVGVNTGASESGSYLGAETFRLLRKPTVAIVAGNGIDYTSFGTLWYAIDHELGLPHSLVNVSDLQGGGLDAYNVVVLPGSWGPMSEYLGKSGADNVKKFVEDGGTLICLGTAAVWAADSSSGLSEVALKRQVLDKLSDYELALEEEQAAEAPTVDTMALYYPKDNDSVLKAEENDEHEVALEADEWQRRFSPNGVILRVNLDPDEWLSFGMRGSVPVMVSTSYALMSKPPVKTVGRIANRQEMRLSGLLWPEARERWAGTSFLTRESVGAGQVILFADDPNHRAYFYGARKLFVNAILYGPGMGTRFDGPYDK